ncbi:AAA family ATPase, partial [Canibacter oris]
RLQFLAGQDEPTVIPNRVTQADVDRVSAELQRLEALVPEAREAHAAASIAVQHKREALDAVDKEIAAAAAALNAYEMQLTKLGGEHAAAIRRQQEREAEHSRRETAASAATSRLEQAEAALKELETAEQAGGSTTAAASDLEQAYNAAGETQTRLETERDQLQAALHRAERDQVALQATHTALAAQLGQHDGGDAVIAAGLPGVHGKVATLVEADATHTAALGLLLGDALLVADEAAATRVLQHAAEADLGRVQVVLATAAPEIDSATTAAQLSPQIAEALVAVGAVHAESVITAASGVKALLHTAFLAPDLASAQRLAATLSGHLEHFTIATSHGEIVTPHTAVGGSATSKSLLEVRAEYDTVTAQLDTATAVVQDAKQRWEAARQAVQEAKTRAAELYRQLRQADSARAEFAAKWQRAAAQVEAAKAEQERARGAVAESENRVAEAAAAVATAAAAVTEFEKQPRPTVEHSVRDELAAAYEEARAAEVEQRMTVQRAQERARSAEGAYRRVREQFHAAEKAEQERAARAVQRNLQARAAQQVLDVLPQWLKQVAADLTAARQAQQEAELERAKHSQELTLLRAEAASVRQELSGLTEQAHSVELQLYERRIGLKSFTERAHNELSLDVATLLAEYGPELPVPDLSGGAGAAAEPEATAHAAAPDVETTATPASGGTEAGEVDPPTKPYNRQEQEQILQAAERALAQLGRINPLALEEFAALEQRHTYLHEQIADLTKTKKDLLQIVADLDVKMETIFAAAFADTKAAFEVVFPILFPGGTGKIELTNPGDMLTTGIEITVKPAGKKVERMSLLSGGERSLAAVAWLLAIFKARPSPFYILDEVEAALDDANLGRLLNAFEDLRQHSQLIVITHQKRTMEIADALYGVSMRGDGVSAVIGQRLSDV